MKIEFYLTCKTFQIRLVISNTKRHFYIRKNKIKLQSNQQFISPHIKALILLSLEKFEKDKLYLRKNMSVINVSKILKHNPKYVSKVILENRNKNFIDYISQLKIDYIIEQLQTQSKFRNYTHEALSEIAGFGSTQTFVRYFRYRTGMSPLFYAIEYQKILQSKND